MKHHQLTATTMNLSNDIHSEPATAAKLSYHEHHKCQKKNLQNPQAIKNIARNTTCYS